MEVRKALEATGPPPYSAPGVSRRPKAHGVEDSPRCPLLGSAKPAGKIVPRAGKGERDTGPSKPRSRLALVQIGQTSRQVSTLENRVTPELRAEIASVQGRLLKREREEQFRLKRLLSARSRPCPAGKPSKPCSCPPRERTQVGHLGTARASSSRICARSARSRFQLSVTSRRIAAMPAGLAARLFACRSIGRQDVRPSNIGGCSDAQDPPGETRLLIEHLGAGYRPYREDVPAIVETRVSAVAEPSTASPLRAGRRVAGGLPRHPTGWVRRAVTPCSTKNRTRTSWLRADA